MEQDSFPEGGRFPCDSPLTLTRRPPPFYTGVAESARLPLETVVADALFKLAGELSLEALRKP